MRLDDDQLNDRLTPIVMQLLNRDTLEQMAAASRALRRPDAARRAAEMLVEMAHTATNRG